jgi:quercetin dioxygenase-like cupin family protein
MMDTNDFNEGKLYINGECIDVENLVWNEHPAFKGVFFKHVIKGESTDNRLSCHLVKINPGCEIGIHNHAGKTELHEIIGGFGHCMIEQTEIDYHKGVIAFIPADKNHSVKAENKGLFLLAKFFPALL